MFKELTLGGLMFSPLVLYIPLALCLSVVTRLIVFRAGLYQKLWKPAWFETGLFLCYLAAVVVLFGRF